MGDLINLDEWVVQKIFTGALEQMEKNPIILTPEDKLDWARCSEQALIFRAAWSLLKIAEKMKAGETIKPSEIEVRANAIIDYNEKLVGIFREWGEIHGGHQGDRQ